MKSFLLIITLNNNNNNIHNVKTTWWISFTNGQPNSSSRQLPRPLFVWSINRRWNRPNYRPLSLSAATNCNFTQLLQRIRHRTVKPSATPTQVNISSGSNVYLLFSILFSATTASPVPSGSMQSSVPIVPARVLKGKKFKRGGRMTSRAYVPIDRQRRVPFYTKWSPSSFRTSRSHAAAKRRLNSTAAGNTFVDFGARQAEISRSDILADEKFHEEIAQVLRWFIIDVISKVEMEHVLNHARALLLLSVTVHCHPISFAVWMVCFVRWAPFHRRW